jgi:hypothetical protein
MSGWLALNIAVLMVNRIARIGSENESAFKAFPGRDAVEKSVAGFFEISLRSQS